MIINTAQGGGGSSLEIFNFPLTISLTEPTPIATGHLWVVHDGPVDFNNIVLDDAVKVDYSNGYLMLIVDDTNNGQDAVTQNKKVGGKKISLTSRRDTNNDTVLPWQVGSLNKGGNIIDIKRKYPRVYSRLNDVLDMETAYVWDGTQWVMVSQKGSYLTVAASGSSSQSFLYNRAVESLSLHSGLPDFPSVTVNCVKWSPDGNYVFYGLNSSPYLVGFKRVGDTFTKLDSMLITTSDNLSQNRIYDISISPDSNYILLAGISRHGTDAGSRGSLFCYKKQSDGTWAYLATLFGSGSASGDINGCDWSPDGNYIVATGKASPYIFYFKRTGDTFTAISNSKWPGGACYKVRYSPDGQYVVTRSSSSPYIICYHIISETQRDIIANPATLPTSADTYTGLVFTPYSNYIITRNGGSLAFYSYSPSGLVNVTNSPTMSGVLPITITPDGTKLAAGFTMSPYLRWYSLSGTTLTELPAPDTLPTTQVNALDFIN